MTDTEVMAEAFEEPEDNSDLFGDIFVETATGYIYEVQMFDTFCLVRIASPNMYGGIQKYSHVEFAGKFHEYAGDMEDLHDYLRGANPDFLVS